MQLLSGTILLKLWLMSCNILANDKVNDGAGPSNPQRDEEICMTNDNIEVLFNIIFGLNVNYNGNEWAEDILPERTLRDLNVVHIIYRDQFRVLFSGEFRNNGISMDDLESRAVHFFQRVLLRMEEMFFEASRSAPNNYQRQVDYIIDFEDCHIDFFFECRFAARGRTADQSPRHCAATINSYRKNGCAVNTVRLSENAKDQNVPWNSESRLLNYMANVVMPCVLVSRLKSEPQSSRNMNLEFNRERFDLFIWSLIYKLNNCNTSHYISIRQGVDVDLERLITDEEYFDEEMRFGELLGMGHKTYHISDSDFNVSNEHHQDHQENYYEEHQNHQDNVEEDYHIYDSTTAWCFNKLRKAFMWFFRRTSSSSTTTQESTRSKRFVKSNDNPEEAIRQRLMDFAFVSLKDQTEANYRKKSLTWSKDFNHLYDQFLHENWTNVLCPNNQFYGGFDNFLYSKLNSHPDWQECISGSFIKDKWCLAVRRIIFDIDTNGKNPWLNESTRPKEFLKDQITVYKILIEIPGMDLELTMTNKIRIKKVQKTNDLYLNNDIFNLGSIILCFAQINPCI